MGAERLPMRQIREILRLRHECGLTHRAIALASGVGLGTVSEYLRRAAQVGLSWPLLPELDDGALEARLFAQAAPARGCWRARKRPKPRTGTIGHEGEARRQRRLGWQRPSLSVKSSITSASFSG
jgi:hypothetical protein